MMVERRDDICWVSCWVQTPKEGGPKGATEPKLFCRCDIDLEGGKKQTQHFCDAVVDSSRYFVLRIVDPRTKRAAHIGVGFRERDDASNFRLALQDYERSLERERTAQSLQGQQSNSIGGGGGSDSQKQQQGVQEGSIDGDSTQQTEAGTVGGVQAAVSNLTLKDGEKIHINLKGRSSAGTDRKAATKKKTGSGPFLLKKPPPPASPNVPKGVADIPAISGDTAATTTATITTGAAAGAVIDDDEEWNDFESGS